MKGDCSVNELCDYEGKCQSTTKLPLGALCTMNENCQSGICIGEICVSVNGQLCVDHLECASHLCNAGTNTCVACGGGFTCPDGAACIVGARCQVLHGQPADVDAECIPPAKVHDGLTCTLPQGEPCTDHFECVYHHCNGAPSGTCGGPCGMGNACPTGTSCKYNISCTLPVGSYCVINDQCESGTCAGFPRKCQ
ncbi:MAG: hypothetical protein IPM54_06270 [Polyangiaceae bacterium]|nr:hypothetical protein [Polyangiaceae bacterium]